MNRSILPGILFILGGALIALLPQSVFPVCTGMVATASGSSVPMKCFWMAKAEIGTGALVVFGGLLFCLCRNPGARFGIAAMTAGAALLAVAFPTLLIGVCPSETMDCHMGTLPALALAGSFVFLVALVACPGLARAMKGKRP